MGLQERYPEVRRMKRLESVMVAGALLSLAGNARGETLGYEPGPRREVQDTGGPPSPPCEPPKKGFFGELGRDFGHLASRESLIILGIGGAGALAVHPFDQRLTDDFRSSGTLDSFFEPADVAGGGFVQDGGAAAVWLAGALSHSQRLKAVGEDLVRAQIVNTTLTQSIKFAADRRRPDGGRWSFPSGHTSASFTTATVLERRFGWKAGVPAYAVAAYIGSSRLQANRHFASDVVFGAAIGIVAGRSATFAHRRCSVSLAPLWAPGAVGIAFAGGGR